MASIACPYCGGTHERAVEVRSCWIAAQTQPGSPATSTQRTDVQRRRTTAEMRLKVIAAEVKLLGLDSPDPKDARVESIISSGSEEERIEMLRSSCVAAKASCRGRAAEVSGLCTHPS